MANAGEAVRVLGNDSDLIDHRVPRFSNLVLSRRFMVFTRENIIAHTDIIAPSPP